MNRNKLRKDTTVNILKSTKKAISDHIEKGMKISPWLEEAIHDRIRRERLARMKYNEILEGQV